MDYYNTINNYIWTLEHKNTIFRQVKIYETVSRQLLYESVNTNTGLKTVYHYVCLEEAQSIS